jgi:secondary thiamine-phosphate synthase enzyme
MSGSKKRMVGHDENTGATARRRRLLSPGEIAASRPVLHRRTNFPLRAGESGRRAAHWKASSFLRCTTMPWIQHELTLPAVPRGFHLITDRVVRGVPELAGVQTGLLHVFIQHTSASLSINENADPDVPADLESSFNAIAPEEFPYQHTCEGPDDMPAHVKASLLGSSLSIPVRSGRLVLGTWQGIYLCEHRNRGGSRRLMLTLHGE